MCWLLVDETAISITFLHGHNNALSRNRTRLVKAVVYPYAHQSHRRGLVVQVDDDTRS